MTDWVGPAREPVPGRTLAHMVVKKNQYEWQIDVLEGGTIEVKGKKIVVRWDKT